MNIKLTAEYKRRINKEINDCYNKRNKYYTRYLKEERAEGKGEIERITTHINYLKEMLDKEEITV